MLRCLFVCMLAVIIAGPASAQSIPGAVLASHEPHHHLTYEDSTLRVLRVRVPAHDTTLLHEHDPDYFWIALGASNVVNAKLGAPDATISSTDLSIHYTAGNFAHVARNPGASPFDNITVELLGAQRNVRNLCEQAISGRPLNCVAAHGARGVTERPAFETDQLRVELVSLDPKAVMHGSGAATWLIAVDTLDARSGLGAQGSGKWRGGVYRSTGSWSVRNDWPRVVRMLVVQARH
jgi:hypothetical protein